MDMQIPSFENLFSKLNKKYDSYDVQKQALKKMGKVVKEEMEDLAPVSENRTKGKHMKDTIYARVKDEYGSLSVEITTSKFYKTFVNWGKSGVAPNPFIAQSADNTRIEVINIAKQDIKRWLHD